MTKEPSKNKTSGESTVESTEPVRIDITRKKFRFGDYIAEKIIKGVAFLSITIIVLIFFFVFREAFPIFSKTKEVKPVAAEQVVQDAQETYGAVTDKTSKTETQETYGDVTDKPLKEETQETYGAVTDSLQVQEQYGVQTNDTSITTDPSDTYTVSAGSGFDDNQSAIKTLITKDWVPVSDKPRYGLLALIVGTFKITLISLLFAAPIARLASKNDLGTAVNASSVIVKMIGMAAIPIAIPPTKEFSLVS